jgi:acyl-CoA reductase-like NAD-dependent aldehyde dehydrogenase
MEARRADLGALCSGVDEVDRSNDRFVWYAGWADKLAQVLGGTNPVAGPYFNFTIPEPTGVVGILAPDEPGLEGLVSRLAPAIVGGNATVAVASEQHPLAAIELAEVLATSDVPGGVVNILTGFTKELVPWLAGHMDVNAIDATGVPEELCTEVEELSAENVKRVHRAPDADPFSDEAQSPYEVTALVEFKTVWHPMGA